MRDRTVQMLLSALLALLTCACSGGSGSGGTSNGTAQPAGQQSTVSVASNVPAATASQITSISSVNGHVSPGMQLPAGTGSSMPMLVATDSTGIPLLIALDSSDGVLDGATTALAMVRICLDLPEVPSDFTNDQVQQAVQSSSNYPALLTAVQRDLTAGKPSLSDDQTLALVWAVAQDASATLGGATSSSAVAKASGTVSTPLPFYLINGPEPFIKVWMTDASGTNNVQLKNQTFITWELDSGLNSTSDLDLETLPPLTTSAWQLIGAYKDSASVTNIKGASPSFNLLLSQTAKARNINGLAGLIKYMLFIYSSVTGFYPNAEKNACIVSVASTVFNDKFADFANEPDGATAIAYFKGALPTAAATDEAYDRFATCGLAPKVDDIFGKAAGQIFKLLQFSRALVSTTGMIAQTYYYWDEVDSYRVCKAGGSVVNCDAIVISDASCSKVAGSSNGKDGPTGPVYSLTASASGTGTGDGTTIDKMTLAMGWSNGGLCVGCNGYPGSSATCSSGWRTAAPGTGSDFGYDVVCSSSGANSSVNVVWSEDVEAALPPHQGIPSSVQACIGPADNSKPKTCVVKPLTCPS